LGPLIFQSKLVTTKIELCQEKRTFMETRDKE